MEISVWNSREYYCHGENELLSTSIVKNSFDLFFLTFWDCKSTKYISAKQIIFYTLNCKINGVPFYLFLLFLIIILLYSDGISMYNIKYVKTHISSMLIVPVKIES